MKKFCAALCVFSALGIGQIRADDFVAQAPVGAKYPASPSEGRAYAHFAADLRDIQKARAELDELEKKLRSDFDSFLEDGVKLHAIALKPGERPGFFPPSKEAPTGYFYAVAAVDSGSSVAPVSSR